MYSIKDVINVQKRQINRLNNLKDIILSKAYEKITHLAKHGELKCIYKIPPYYFGYPSYNQEEITNYLRDKLIKEQLCVIKLDRDKLFISWDIVDINFFNKKNIKEKQNLDNLMPLINIKKNIK
tara:strand:- start:5727 stop:6098 length:372 start_codon:yes stop_codon:yes gene_type:complete